MKLRIGSRASKLAVTQAEWIGQQLKTLDPRLDVSYIRMTTSGDRQSEGAKMGGLSKGIFVKELEEALVVGQIDLAVHSLKDVPQNLPPGLILGPTPQREDPRDAFISRFGEFLHELPRHSIIGTSSPRRQAQIRHRYQRRAYDLQMLRGNIDTRLKKLQEGQFDGIVLAAAGLKRLGLESEITQILEPDEMLPAPCQGCLGLELKESNSNLVSLLQNIHDPLSDLQARAERAFLQGLGGNCNVPVGVYSHVEKNVLRMKAELLDSTGETSIVAEQSGSGDQPELAGAQLAERLLHDGGSEIMMTSGPRPS